MVKKGAVKKRELLKAKSAREVKKAQLFIIAAVIIVGVLFSLFAVTNYVKTKPKPTAFYDLSEELSSESSQVIDYATYTQCDANSLVQDFSQKYADYCCNSTSDDVELVFVYGNSGQLTMMNYSTTQTVTSGGELGGTSASFTTTTREPQITNMTTTVIPTPARATRRTEAKTESRSDSLAGSICYFPLPTLPHSPLQRFRFEGQGGAADLTYVVRSTLSWKFIKLTPNTCSRILTRAKTEKTMAKPMRAAVILFRAFSVPSLSPPAIIHWTPPISSQKKATRPAATKRILMALWTNPVGV